jgi:polyhydroxyalkanoate synthesis regulator phasin
VDGGTLRELLGQLGLAAVGAVSLTAERVDRLADELSARGGMRREEAKSIIEDMAGRWRAEASRVGERTTGARDDLFANLGLVTRDDFEELELRVAQLEHRLKLLEPPLPGTNGAPPKV